MAARLSSLESISFTNQNEFLDAMVFVWLLLNLSGRKKGASRRVIYYSVVVFWIWIHTLKANMAAFRGKKDASLKTDCNNMHREENQLDATEWFLALIICSTCFGHFYDHHQELDTILVLLPHMVSNALFAGGRWSGAGQQLSVRDEGSCSSWVEHCYTVVCVLCAVHGTQYTRHCVTCCHTTT
jgi:hypothetical protein